MRNENDLRIPAYGVHKRLYVELQDLLAVLTDEGWPVYVLTGVPTDKGSFFASVRNVLPLDPPWLEEQSLSWDALFSSLCDGVYKLHAEKVAIVWPGSDRLRAGDSDAFAGATEIFTQLVFTEADPAVSPDVTRVLVLLA